MVFSPAEVMRIHLGSIDEYYKGVDITVIFKADVAGADTYGAKTKTKLSITTRGNLNAVENMKIWGADGHVPGSNLLVKIWSLSSGGVDYLQREYFTNDRIDNVLVLIGDIYYKVISVQAPVSTQDMVPYWIFACQKIEGVVVDV